MALVQGLHTGDAGVDGLAPGLERCGQLLDLQFHLGARKGQAVPRGSTTSARPRTAQDLTSCSSSCTCCSASWSSGLGSSRLSSSHWRRLLACRWQDLRSRHLPCAWLGPWWGLRLGVNVASSGDGG